MNLNLNRLNVYKSLFHLDLMIIFTMKRKYFKMPDFDALSLLDIKSVIHDPMVSAKMGNLSENTKLSSHFDLNILLNSGRHQMLSKLASLSLSSVRKLDEAINMIENMICMKQLSLLDVILYLLFVLTLILKLTTLDTSSKFHSFIKVLNL